VTASNLVKIDCDGSVLSETPYKVNRAGFVIHSAVHAARHDVACVIHTHTDVGTAISATRAGLLPVSQDACLFYNRVAYHDYEGIATDLDERERLVRDLGPHMVMILRNHGLLSCGRTVAEAFVLMWRLEKACRIQMMLMAAKADIRLIPDALAEKTAQSFPWMRFGTPAGEMDWPNLLHTLEAADPGYKD
jgi:ribulose-5-phosphate 4-epimerase/fuculose-1-phosphate aldolase